MENTSKTAQVATPPVYTPAVPLRQTPQPQYGGFWIRYAAFTLDVILLTIIQLILFSAGIGFGIKSISSESMGFLGLAIGTVYVVPIIVYWAYFLILTRKYGATLGKKLFNLKVVAQDLGPVSWKTVVMREVLGKMVNGLTFDIGFIWAGFDEKKQGFHDKIASTYVILEKPLSIGKKILAVLIALALPLLILAFFGILFSVLLVAINPALRIKQAKDVNTKTNVANIATALENYLMDNKTGKYPSKLEDLPNYESKIKPSLRESTGVNYKYVLCPDDSALVYANLQADQVKVELYVWNSKDGTFSTIKETPTCIK